MFTLSLAPRTRPNENAVLAARKLLREVFVMPVS
jgi:hypothetical protein